MKRKRCVTCGEVKALSRFHHMKKAKDKHQSSCKGCMRAYQVAHPGRGKVAAAKWIAKQPDGYHSWKNMCQRCANPNKPGYKYWGGRGIEIDPSWTGRGGFKQFIADVGERPGSGYTIDRRNHEGPYNKENCKWSTWVQQANNRRARGSF